MIRRAFSHAALLALLAPAASALGVGLSGLAEVEVGATASGLQAAAGVAGHVGVEARVDVGAPPPPMLALPAAALIGIADAARIEPPPASRTLATGPAEALADAPPETIAAIGGGLVFLALLYFRVQPDQLLDHERRERVVALVRERPGIGPSELAAALGAGWGAAMHHLDRLERAGFVTSRRMGHHRCYFVPGALPKDAQAQVGLFRGATARRIAQLLLEKPGLTQTQLCDALDLSASAASKQLTRLEAAALVRREAAREGVRVFPQPDLSRALAPA